VGIKKRPQAQRVLLLSPPTVSHYSLFCSFFCHYTSHNLLLVGHSDIALRVRAILNLILAKPKLYYIKNNNWKVGVEMGNRVVISSRLVTGSKRSETQAEGERAAGSQDTLTWG
jgi:hypothetical protein